MACCEANAICSSNQTNDSTHQFCHPHLRENYRNIIPAETKEDICMQNRHAWSSCCHAACKEPFCMSHYHEHPENFKQSEQKNHVHCVAHSCPLGKVICCTDCMNNDCEDDKDIIKAKDICETREGIICHAVPHQEPVPDDITITRERPCCAKKPSWTEPRLCRCDNPIDPSEYLKSCSCECGAARVTEFPEQKPKKTVRFVDETIKSEDCKKAFQNLDIEDVKRLCSCCKECAIIGKAQCIGKPVLVYELPEPKLEDTSITQKDFCWQKIPPREVPPWHPNIKDRWRHVDVPSLCETTYQCDFKPPAVAHCPEKNPVYLAPRREEIDPCQQLAEEYCSWKKTSVGPKHTYHSSCDECDKDLQKVHLHECNVDQLPPQYQCHGDGHICQPTCHTTVDKFTLCEQGDTGASRHWWKRTCCVPEKVSDEKLDYLPPDLMKPVCPPYTTSYKHDFSNPQRLQSKKLFLGRCRACEGCARPEGEEQPNLLCTKNTPDDFTTQRVGII